MEPLLVAEQNTNKTLKETMTKLQNLNWEETKT